MKNESRIFNGVAAFLYITAIIYAWWGSKTSHGLDWTGTTALVLSGTLTAMCGMYFQFVARRIEPRPEDRSDAEISDGAGELGFFSPGSYWPFGVALAAATAGLGFVYLQVWLIIMGAAALLLTIGGLLFEYYTRPADTTH
jgi:hypothetical protein